MTSFDILSDYILQDIFLEMPYELILLRMVHGRFKRIIETHNILQLLARYDLRKIETINVSHTPKIISSIIIPIITQIAIKENNFECLKYLCKYIFPQIHNYVIGILCEISSIGNIEMLKYVCNMCNICNIAIFNESVTLFMSRAITNNHLTYLKYLYEYYGKWNNVNNIWATNMLSESVPPYYDLCACASMNGNLECLQYLHEHHCEWNVGTCIHAAQNGHLLCLEYAHDHKCPWDGRVYYVAIDNFTIVKYLIESGCPLDGYCDVVHANNIETLEYLYKHKFPNLGYSYGYYAEHNNLGCIKLLFEYGYEIPFGVCESATKVNAIDCLKYLHTHGGKWDSLVCRTASEYNAYECLTYAHEHGCKWDESVCDMASKKNNIKCLRYAHENNCPWNKKACVNASKYGSLECLKYLIENKCPNDFDVLFYNSAHFGHLECFKFLMSICVADNHITHNRTLIANAVFSTQYRYILKYYDSITHRE